MVSGNLTETVAGNPTIWVVGINGAVCDRTPAGFECSVPTDASNPRIEIFGYGKKNFDYWACSTGNTLEKNSDVTNDTAAKAVFELHNSVGDDPVGAGYNINIQATACPFI